MKTPLVVVLACLVIACTGCESLGSLTYQQRVGSGKAYVSLENGGYNFGYRGTLRSKPIPGSGKQVLPPQQVAEPATPTKPAVPAWLAFLNIFGTK